MFGGYTNNEIVTIIESKNGKKVKLPGYRVLKSDQESKVYVAGCGELLILSVEDLSIQSEYKMDKYFNFAAFRNGKFYYQQIILDEDEDAKAKFKEVKVTE